MHSAQRALMVVGLAVFAAAIVAASSSSNENDPDPRAFRIEHLDQVLRLLGEQPSMSIVQIGAYIGDTPNDPLYKFLHKQLRGAPAGAVWPHKIVLVEPIREYFDQLRKNYLALPHIVLENVAIAETEGEMEMYRLDVDPTKHGHPEWLAQLSSLKKERVEDMWQFKGTEKQRFYLEHRIKETVKTVTLQQLFARNQISELDLLQVDAEGYDFEILKMLDFSKIKPRFIGYERLLLHEQEPACRKMLEDQGYRLFDRGPDTLAIRMN